MALPIGYSKWAAPAGFGYVFICVVDVNELKRAISTAVACVCGGLGVPAEYTKKRASLCPRFQA
jgi:hypothetical protein